MIIINKVIYEFIKLIFVSCSSQGIFSHKTNTLNALHVHVRCGIQYFFYFTCTVCIVYKNNLIVLTLCVCVCVCPGAELEVAWLQSTLCHSKPGQLSQPALSTCSLTDGKHQNL